MNKLTEKNTHDRLTTLEIKQGLQKIKKTQLELLKQLRGEGQSKPSSFNLLTNNQNLNIASNLQKSESYQTLYHKDSQMANTKAQLASFKKIVQTEKEEIQIKYKKTQQQLQIIQRDYKQLQTQKRKQQEKFRQLQRQKLKFEQQNVQLERRLFEFELEIKRNKNQAEKSFKQKEILQVQIQTLKSQLINLKSINQKSKKQVQQLKIKANRRESSSSSHSNSEKKNNIQSNHGFANAEKIINQVKKISFNHDRLYDKLKQFTKIGMNQLQIEDDIQLSISKLLGYLEKQGRTDKKQGRGSLLEEEESVIYQKVNKFDSESFRDDVRRLQKEMMGTQNLKREINQLKNQNYQLRQKIKQSKQQNQEIKEQIQDSKRYKKYYENNIKSSKIVNYQIEDLKAEVDKLRLYKQRLRSDEQQRQESLKKYKIKIKESQIKIQAFERQSIEIKGQIKLLQKKLQNSEHQKDDLNQIIKKLNKLNSSQDQSSSQSHKKLRDQFNRIVQANQLLIRQKQSLKAMNDGLQVQIHNLKYQKDQYQKNNAQKHELIQREIKQRQNLLEQLQKKNKKFNQREVEVENLKNKLQNQQNHTLEMRSTLQKQLQIKSSQILALRKQIQSLYKQSRQLNQLRFHHDRLQAVFKQQKRKSRQLTQTVDHLWAVKETQYENVHKILGSFIKNKQTY